MIGAHLLNLPIFSTMIIHAFYGPTVIHYEMKVLKAQRF